MKHLVVEEKNSPIKDEVLFALNNNVVSYISGYVVRNIKEKFCNICHDDIFRTRNYRSSILFIFTKQYGGCKDGLGLPGSSLVRAMKEIERVYCDQMSNMSHRINLKQTFFVALSGYMELLGLLSFGCSEKSCEFKKLVLQLFINIHIRPSLKQYCLSFVPFTDKGKF